jgi:hypothetical protein
LLGARAFTLENRKVKADRMSDQDCVIYVCDEFEPHLSKSWRAGYSGIVDLVNSRGSRWDRLTWVNQPSKRRVRPQSPALQTNSGNLANACVTRIEACSFGIDDNRVKCNERRDASTHGLAFPVALPSTA